MPLPRRFRAVRHLSDSLYGGVFLCFDRNSDTRVVVKQIDLLRAMQLLNSPEPDALAVDDPRQEKAVCNLLRRTGGHPNVVQYLDDLIEDRMLYFAMEYCADGDLYEHLSRQEKSAIAPMDALAMLAQVTAGVSFLHAHNVAHRDLSLENVMLHRGVCKIGDFGLSTRADRLCKERVGKAYYIAPEVVAGESYDPKAADMWSLGIILFILLTGSPLVPIASEEDKAFKSFKRAGLRAVLESWGVAASLSMELIELLVGLLEVDPTKRLTVQEVLEHRAFVSWTVYSPHRELSEPAFSAEAVPEPEMVQACPYR